MVLKLLSAGLKKLSTTRVLGSLLGTAGRRTTVVYDNATGFRLTMLPLQQIKMARGK